MMRSTRERGTVRFDTPDSELEVCTLRRACSPVPGLLTQ